MDFLEHDLKTLQEDMQEPFLPSEIKTLLLQLVSATDYLHSHWIVHRDLKTSNLLMNNRGQMKVADFGMARYFGDPPPKMTQLVVTLWYRAPELLLGADDYGKEVDVWSIGCIFGELLTKEPLLQGKNEVDQLSKVITGRVSPCRIPTSLSDAHKHPLDLRALRYPNGVYLARLQTTSQREIPPSPAHHTREVFHPLSLSRSPSLFRSLPLSLSLSPPLLGSRPLSSLFPSLCRSFPPLPLSLSLTQCISNLAPAIYAC
jgi:serine/threonine protein kinase